MGTEAEPGLVPLTVSEIFQQIETIEDREFLIRVGYIEIYNEKVLDLLNAAKSEESLELGKDSIGNVIVNQVEMLVNSEKEILSIYDTGNKNKKIAETQMNERSSRSHTLFRISIESRERDKTSDESAVQISHLYLVDLAGSEKADNASNIRFKEGANINKSLLSLGSVIRLLSEAGDNEVYINYRDSKLTRILKAALGGNSMTAIICTITPAALEESYYTLT